MQFKILKIFIFTIILYSTNLWAGLSCEFIKQLDNPALYNSPKFWDDYRSLTNSGKINDQKLAELLQKHGVNPPPVPSSSAPKVASVSSPNSINFSTTKIADKDIAKLGKKTRENYEDFLGIMVDRSGIQKLYANPGRWHMEKMTDKDTYTVRLDGDIRVLFKIEKNDLTVMQVNREKVHKL